MNIFVECLEDGKLPAEPDLASEKLVVEDNVGEGIHVHIRNVRLEMSIEDFRTFANELACAQRELTNGDR